MNIEKEELVRRLKIAEPYNNKDIPQYVWSIINAIPSAERTDDFEHWEKNDIDERITNVDEISEMLKWQQTEGEEE